MNKRTSLLLAGSLILNAALAAVLVVGAAGPPSETKTGPGPRAPVRAVATGPVVDASVWPSLSSGDLPSLVAHLREAGFPRDMVRAIAMVQIAESYAARRKALDPDADRRPFWKAQVMAPSVVSALRQLGREQEKVLRDLLGADADPDDPMSRARDSRMFGHLPPEKAAEARRIVREYNEIRSDYFTSYGGAGIITISAADREKINSLEKQMQGDLAKIMTPQEYTDYDLRGSNTANSLRSQLSAFDPSEAEFRTLFQLQRTFDERHGQMFSQPSQEEMRLRMEAQRQLTDQIKVALGPVRAADYDRATNYEYRTTGQLVARLELPPETTNQVWAVHDDIQRRADQFRQDASLTPVQRTEQLAVLQKEAVDKLTPLLGGPRGVEAFKQYGGQWIQNLAPAPRNAANLIPAR